MNFSLKRINFMLKFYFMLFLITVQFSAYAYELLSSKTTVSPGCEGGILEQITESYISLSNDYSAALTAFTGAKVFSATGNAREMVMLRSTHHFSIQNNTDRPQTIKLDVRLCTMMGNTQIMSTLID